MTDIQDAIIDTSLTKEERIQSYLEQIKNPHCYKCDNMIYTMFKASFNKQIETAEKTISGLQEQINKLKDSTQNRTLIEKFKEHENITELSRRIVVNFIEAIVIYGSKDYEIRFRYAGEYPHAQLPPYGYIFSTEGKKKRLELEPQAAKVVKLIFDRRQQGWGTVTIAEYLNANNVLTPGRHYCQLGITTHKKHAASIVWQKNT